jgi:hypothetical protein
VSQTVTRIIALLAVALAALAGFAQARTGARRPGAHAAACHVRVSRIARGQGSPDDLVWDARTLLVSDINSGRIGALVHGHLRTLVSHLRDPEGIVPGPGHSLIVAEQATNRVLEINLANGSRSTLAKLPLPAGKSGVDGINADGPGAVYIPDSARGRLYVLHLRPRKLSLVARGMNRPVAALNWGHATVVADEYASAIWRIGPKRTRTRLSSPATSSRSALAAKSGRPRHTRACCPRRSRPPPATRRGWSPTVRMPRWPPTSRATASTVSRA